MTLCDLHIHTTYSDGFDSPEKILRDASRKNIQYLSFTDHDSLYWFSSKSDKYFAMAYQMGIQLIRGIEISARDTISGKKTHILGYWRSRYPLELPSVASIISDTRDMRNRVALVQIDRLNKMGYSISETKVMNLTLDGQIFKHHIFLALKMEGYIDEILKSDLQKLFLVGNECYVKKEYPSSEYVIQSIRKDGGFSVLAHPGENDNICLIPSMKQMGLWGIEHLHPSHSRKIQDDLFCLAEKYRLKRTGGSDYHGSYYRTGVLGEYSVSDIDLADLILPEVGKS